MTRVKVIGNSSDSRRMYEQIQKIVKEKGFNAKYFEEDELYENIINENNPLYSTPSTSYIISFNLVLSKKDYISVKKAGGAYVLYDKNANQI